MPFNLKPVEVRAFISDILRAKTYLDENNATYQGAYCSVDHMYFPITPVSNVSYGRIRVYTESNWKHKAIVVTIKSILQQVLYKQEFDKIEEAEVIFENDYNYAFQFSRRGWQYTLNNCSIFVEDIEGLPGSIEVIAEKTEDIYSLFDDIGVERILEVSIPLFFL